MTTMKSRVRDVANNLRGSRMFDGVSRAFGNVSVPSANAGSSMIPTVAAGFLGIAAGGLAMFLLDPDRGGHRRTMLMDRVGSVVRSGSRRAGGAAEDVSSRVQATPAAVSSTLATGRATDDVLVARVREAIGHAIRHAGAIDVQVHDGTAILVGPALRDEADEACAAARAVPGIRAVESRLDVHEEAGSIPALQD